MPEIVNLLTKMFVPTTNYKIGGINRTNRQNTSSNPFASSNPFVGSSTGNPFATYGQNRPVLGGYFAGYYNNQPNIVGRRLFIEA